MKRAAFAIALALAVSALNILAQDAGGPPASGGGPSGGGPGGGPGREPGGLRLLPPRAQEQLNLTADQQKQLADLEAEVKAKIEKILTPEQLQQLKQMRPPMRQGGPGGNGPQRGQRGGGPDGGGGGESQPNAQRPPSE